MADRHLVHWPESLPQNLGIPETDLYYNVEVSATRFPNKPYLIFYDTPITFSRFKKETECLAGWLEKKGVQRGDRVLLYMQNSPQFAIGYYAILRANAVVVPVNPMNMTAELRHCIQDSGSRIALVAQDLYAQAQPLIGAGLEEVLLVCYSDYLEEPTTLKVPDFVRAPRTEISDSGTTLWHAALRQQLIPGPVTVGSDDLCVMPYTSGTTGQPKGCMHTHRSVMHTLLTSYQWFGAQQDAVHLAVLPLFHVTGMQGSMNGPMYAGCTVVLMPRWDRVVAAECIERYRVSSWTAMPTMLVDFLAQPALESFDLDSLCRLVGGGAAMPESVAQALLDRGITYVEGYGLSETMGPSHINPPRRVKKQCLGIPVFDTHSIVVDPQNLKELPPGEVGEVLIRGPQVFQGYWNNPAATEQAFVEIAGQRWFRTGDLARVDDDGYFFMVDRLKRMINASGFKVWPAEVEALMYQHPAIQEACVIPASDAKRGETVKAVIVLRPTHRGRVSEQDIVDWARGAMAAYKSPRIVEFTEALPKSATGKILWRQLQEREATRSAP